MPYLVLVLLSFLLSASALADNRDVDSAFPPTSLRIHYSPVKGFISEIPKSASTPTSASRVHVLIANSGYSATWNRATRMLMFSEQVGFGQVREIEFIRGAGFEYHVDDTNSLYVSFANNSFTGARVPMLAYRWRF
ncbi:MAG: hypothetical protein JWN18_251 [Parcubacteria group bacterium]|nr:hypothetical protein [Parcubacteria group bacterium]